MIGTRFLARIAVVAAIAGTAAACSQMELLGGPETTGTTAPPPQTVSTATTPVASSSLPQLPGNTTPPPTASGNSAQAGSWVTMQSGDTLYSLATRHGVPISWIEIANGITDPTDISVGQQLFIPGSAPSGPVAGAGTSNASVGAEPGSNAASNSTGPAPDTTELGTLATANGPSTHTVAAGETYYAISRRYNVTVDALAAANGLSVSTPLEIGQMLQIPGAAGGGNTATADASVSTPPPPAANEPQAPAATTYVVQAGDNLTQIANAHGVSVAALAAANGLNVNQPSIRIGQSLTIPDGGTQVAAVQPSSDVASDASPAGNVPPVPSAGLRWPIDGAPRVMAQFGSAWAGAPLKGIKLDVPQGTPVKAAEAGTVHFVGELADYGTTVILMHANGMLTIYGHLRDVSVSGPPSNSSGSQVARGQQIGTSGMTGSVTRPQLHFEIRDSNAGNVEIDPLTRLPAA